MKLDKAIEALSELREIAFINKSPERNSAVKLGIEALKWRQRYVGSFPKTIMHYLLGETKE